MKTETQCCIGLTGITLLLSLSSLSATTHYVFLGNSNAVPPYTTWATAAANIQDAVNVGATHDVVLVTNGVYPGGVTVTNPLALVSVNGPQSTVINGCGTNPCLSLTDSASLTGFTLTNGVDNIGNGGGGVWCASTNAFLTNCVLAGNSAPAINGYGGYGGGACAGSLYNCTLSGNSAAAGGGGAYRSGLYNCTLGGNFALYGGGAYEGTLHNCTLGGNSSGNSAGGGPGGGAYESTLYNCTLSGNSAYRGGGAYNSTLYNCIAYFNTASSGPANYDPSSTLAYCCTTPLPTIGFGNISLDPQLASPSHLSADSPCRGAGSAAYATGTDIDGEAWNNPPSIGCDEYHPGAVTGPLTVSAAATYTNVAVGYAVNLTAFIGGRVTDCVWEFGDGDVALNEPYPAHSWTQAGDYLVALWAFNESNPGGVSATLTVHVVAQPVVYVAASSTNSQPPYTNWATAATNLQAAVRVALPGGLVLVANGAYPGGVIVTTALALFSINGPQFTVINGGRTNLCISLARGASLTGFTLTNGSGGVACAENAFITNCVISTNLTTGASGGSLYNCVLSGNSGYQGGGAFGSTLYNCALNGNSGYQGGGAFGSTLYNCTLVHNVPSTPTSPYFGAAFNCTLHNCIAYFNLGPNYDVNSLLDHCCTTPLRYADAGTISVPPLFVDLAHGNLRLQSDSPCINAGNNAYVTTTTDLDGNPRIVSGTADIGAYEYQGSGSFISYAWLQQYGLLTDGSVDGADLDATGFTVYQDWVAGLNPTNALSVLALLPPTPTNNPAGLVISWESVANISYFLQRSTNLTAQPAFTMLQSNIVGQAGTTSYTDTNATGPGPFFYRVGVTAP